MAKAFVPNMSTIRAVGGSFMERIAERRCGSEWCIVNPIRAPIGECGPSSMECCTDGSVTMLIGVLRFEVCRRICERVVEGSVDTTKMVTWKA